MPIHRRLLCGLGMLLLCSIVYGCTTLTPEQHARIEANANRKIICTKGSDCAIKWGRAITWISQNSRWKIQLQNDFMIQTYTSTNGSPDSSFLVNKVPIDNQTFEIVMSSGCGNMFGCVPNGTMLKAMFTNFLIGPAPTTTPPTPPNQEKPSL